MNEKEKINKYLELDEKRIEKKNSSSKSNKLFDFNYVIKISVLTFFISIILSYLSDLTLSGSNIIIATIIIIIIVFIGLLADMVGVAAISGNEKSFNAMASKKIKGAKIGVYLIKNADKVSSIGNDVISDICGIVSGSAGAVLSVKLTQNLNNELLKIIIPLVVISVVAAFTTGGKALGKSIALRYCERIILFVSKILAVFKKDG